MKNKELGFVFAVAIIVVSTAYARRGSNNMFDSTVNPLMPYAGQIIGTDEAPAPAEPFALEEEGFSLFGN